VLTKGATGTVAKGRFVRPMFGEYVKPTPPATAVIPEWEPSDLPTTALTRVIDTALVQPGSAVATRITDVSTQLTSDLNNAIAGEVTARNTAITAIDNRVTVNEGSITAANSRIGVVESKVNNPTTGLTALAADINSVKTNVTTNGTDIAANAQKINQLQASVGPQGNLLANANFTSKADWTFTYSGNFLTIGNATEDIAHYPDWGALESGGNEGTVVFTNSGTATGARCIIEQFIPIEPGKYYYASIYFIGEGRIDSFVNTEMYDVNGNVIAGTFRSCPNETHFNANRRQLGAYKRIGVLSVLAPSNVAKMRFRAVGNVTGSGTVYIFFVRPMVTEAIAGQTAPAPWSVGRDPELFGAIQETQTVWAEKSGTDGATAGARYTLKVRAGDQFNSAQAGFGMSSEKIGGQWVSDFRVLADRFAVVQNIDSAPAATHPFAIINGATYIKKAFIKDADIDTLKIAGEAVVVPRVTAQTAAAGFNSTGWTTIDQVTLTLATWSKVIVSYEAEVDSSTSQSLASFELRMTTRGTQHYLKQFVEGNYIIGTAAKTNKMIFRINWASTWEFSAGTVDVAIQGRVSYASYSRLQLKNRFLYAIAPQR
jgi:hypothetical protein